MAGRQTKAKMADLFIEPASDMPSSESRYDPLPSVWYDSDAELLEKMLDFYPRRVPEAILDATVNGGRFWIGSDRPVTGMDIDPKHKPDVVGDNTDMPFEEASFDVVVYDPPHIPNQGKDNEKDFNTRFGLVIKSNAKQGYNFSHMYPPFCREAYRVLRPEGILLCKIADYVHGHRFQWAHVELLQAAVAVGFTACDCIVKIRKGPIVDPKWKTAHHARRQHCYWLVFRKSKKMRVTLLVRHYLLPFGKHRAAIHAQTAKLTLAVRAVEMDVEDYFARFEHVKSEAPPSLPSAHW